MPTYTAPGVYVEEVPSSQKVLSAAPTAVAAFVGFTERAPTDDPNDPNGVAPRLVTSWSQFEGLYGGFSPGCVLPLSVYGYFANGGSIAYICRIANTAPAGQPSRLTLPAADRALGEPLVVESLEPDAPISIEIASIDPGENAPEGPSPFTLTVLLGGEPVETFENVDFAAGERNVKTVINKTSTKIKVDITLEKGANLATQLDVLKPGRYELQKATPVPVPVSSRKFAGSESARNGINGLAVADEVTMVVVPDLITAATKDDGTVDLNLWKAVQTALISHCEQNGKSLLNPIGINCIRPFGTRGIRIWGARTLASDSDWRYINVRRLFNMIESTILEGTQWAVFEPNDMALWEGVKRTLNGFLRGLWQAGALFGATADQAFYVKCDEETNPPQSIDEGKLVVEVGIAPVKPAEFVVFRISQQKQIAA